MTVIAALHQNGETWIGCDSLITEGGQRFRGHSKLIEGNGVVFGWSGSYRTFGLIQQNVASITGTPWQMANAVRALLKDDGYQSASGMGALDYGPGLIIATPAAVYDLTDDFSVYRAADGEMVARGSGARYALGASQALESGAPFARVQAAVAAACHFDVDCGGEHHFRSLDVIKVQAAAQ